MRACITTSLAFVAICSGFPFVAKPFTAAEYGNQPPQRFSTRTDVVTLDVSVLDRNRQPVRDLRAADFTVRENGTAQAIEYFQQIDLPDPRAHAASWTRDASSDVARNDVVMERRLVVVLIDDAMIPFDPYMRNTARKIARTVIDRLSPADLAAVIFTMDNRPAQNFTRERPRLQAAIDRMESAGFTPSPSVKDDIMVAAMQTLFRVVDTVAAIPERRKSLVYISTGIPLLIDSPETSKSSHPYMNWLAKRALMRAQQGNVNIYTVDPGGLDGLRMLMLSRNHRAESWVMEQIEQAAIPYREFLKAVADQTGGHAFINTNEFTSRIDQMFRETGSFYLLGYRSQDQRADGRFRRLQVWVNRPGVTVRARSGYYAPSARASKMALPAFPTDDAIAGLVPKTDLPLELAAIPIPLTGRREAAVILTLAGHATPPPGEVEKLDVLLRAFTHEGDPRGATRITAQVSRPAQGVEPAAYEILGRLDLPPGRYEVRASAASATSGLSGSVYGYVDVPDFAGDALTLSGIAIGATSAAGVGNLDSITGLLSFAPTTRRVFATTDRVTAFVRVHQKKDYSPAPVTVVRRVIDATDRAVLDERATLEADAFANARGADVQFEIPMARLASGRHLLVVEATRDSHSVRRAIPFEVK
jgi:VWFA-related protein